MKELMRDKWGDPYMWLVLLFMALVLILDFLFTVNVPAHHVVMPDESSLVADEEPAALNAPIEIADMQKKAVFATVDTTLGEPLPNFWDFTGAPVDALVQDNAVTGS